MSAPLPTAAGLAYREAGPGDAPAVLLLHGYPESSYMWRDLMAALAAAGLRAIAPDFAGYGDSPVDRPGTWERHMESVERFRRELGLDRVALVVHDWGGLIGLRWACEHPDAVSALVISDTGFFPDGRWHGMADAMRTEGTGEELVDGLTREAFGQLLRSVATGFTDDALDEYYKAYADEPRRRAMLEMYRSGEFSKLAQYDGALAAMDVPTLLLWGADDAFAPVGGAHRFAKQIPHAELEILEGIGHFAIEDAPDAVAGRVVPFLSAALSPTSRTD